MKLTKSLLVLALTSLISASAEAKIHGSILTNAAGCKITVEVGVDGRYDIAKVQIDQPGKKLKEFRGEVRTKGSDGLYHIEIINPLRFFFEPFSEFRTDTINGYGTPVRAEHRVLGKTTAVYCDGLKEVQSW